VSLFSLLLSRARQNRFPKISSCHIFLKHTKYILRAWAYISYNQENWYIVRSTGTFLEPLCSVNCLSKTQCDDVRWWRCILSFCDSLMNERTNMEVDDKCVIHFESLLWCHTTLTFAKMLAENERKLLKPFYTPLIFRSTSPSQLKLVLLSVHPSTKGYFPIRMKVGMLLVVYQWYMTVHHVTWSKVKVKVTILS